MYYCEPCNSSGSTADRNNFFHETNETKRIGKIETIRQKMKVQEKDSISEPSSLEATALSVLPRLLVYLNVL